MIRLLIVCFHWHSALLLWQALMTSLPYRAKKLWIIIIQNITHVKCCICTNFFPKQTGKGTSINISVERKTTQVKTSFIFLSCSWFWKNFSLNVLVKKSLTWTNSKHLKSSEIAGLVCFFAIICTFYLHFTRILNRIIEHTIWRTVILHCCFLRSFFLEICRQSIAKFENYKKFNF